jgi:excisionase family DNA binding protein
MSTIKSGTIGIKEAGRRLGISRTTAYKLAQEGSIATVPVYRIGRQLRVPVQALERVLNGERLGGEAA